MVHHVKMLVAVLIIAMLICASDNALAKIEKLNEVEGISEYRLDNGLQILLFPDQTKETVTVNVTYRVGSKHENYGETGMAHLLEHLVFKGTPTHKDIPAELSAAGARPNGTTWTDRTNYYETFAATSENVNWALSMEASRMVDSFIAKEDLDSEMTVVRNEFESGENDPFRVTLQRMVSVAYDWHNYGKSTIGARSDLENVPIDKLKAFYKRYYQPDNATLIVAGKFENSDMIKLVDQYFSPIKKSTRILPTLYTADPAKSGERSVVVRRVGDSQIVGSAYHIPAGSHSDYAAIEVLNQIFGDTPSGRLYKNLVEAKLASFVNGFNFQWQEPGLSMYFAVVDKVLDASKTADTMIASVENIDSNPITQEEVDRVKRNLLKNIELSFNSSERIALQLSEWLAMGDWRLYFLHRDRIEKVSLDDVQRVARQYFVRNNRTLGQFIPSEKSERVDIPIVANVSEMVKGYKGREAIAQGELFEPSFDNIDKRSKVVEFNNGTKLSLLSKKTRGESVIVNLVMRYGNESKLTGKGLVAQTAGNLLLRGAAGMSRQDIQDEFDKLKAQVRVSAGTFYTFASISTTKENLSEVLTLLAKIMKNPSYDAKEFEQYVDALKVGIEQNLQDPQRLAFNEYSRLQNPYEKGHPLYVATFEEKLNEIKQLDLNDVKTFHQKYLGANNLHVGVVGDFDNKAITDIFKALFTNWDSGVSFAEIKDEYKKVKPQNVVFDTPDKENATFVAALSLPIGQDHPDAAAVELGDYIFGGGFLNSRLATRLRQEEGLSYGAGSFVTQNAITQKSSFGAYAICAPQNLEKVEIGFKEELSRMLKDGFTDEEISAAKSGLLQEKRVSRAQDAELVSTLRLNLRLERDMQWYKAYEARLNALSAQDVQDVMQKYFKLEDFSIVKAGDMTKAAAQK